MKKLSLLLIFGILFIWIGLSHAAGSVTQGLPVALFDSTGYFGSAPGPDPKYMVQVTLTADVLSGPPYTYPTFQINGTCSSATGSCTGSNILRGWYLFKIESWAGSTAPTTAWTATVTDSFGAGYDFCAAKVVGSNSTTPVFTDCYPGGQNYMFVNGPLTVATTGNNVSGAIIYMNFYFLPR